ncbi:hypothetical protein C8A05DRAFT_20003 [Staphylotrichum tortipilum]|uniref:Uncharacterized protein n=1 Tax=Staphylotrichum tortipilum TaxID=2831512 RepID=A0AAN6MBP3_9PEZI|nr:hypothetical protein C8A05DRAFT_20003 [Staphylotrichum longicolle]
MLDPVHRALLDLAIRKVIGTERALETFAQIADGLPLSSVARDRYTRWGPFPNHPVLARHTTLCPGATEAALAFLFEFNLSHSVAFSKALLRAYQWTHPCAGRSFESRLIELVARAVHELAVVLFQRRLRIHDSVWADRDPMYKIDAVKELHPVTGKPYPTPFCHLEYGNVEQYPDGIADVVGYWAENRILGGVVLLDRSDAWDDRLNPEPNVFLHSDYDSVTTRVWRALDEQQQALVDFLLSRPPAGAPRPRGNDSPLPLLASDKNLDRIDSDCATINKVYRDFWERWMPPQHGRFLQGSCRQSALDYPEQRRHSPDPLSYCRPERPSDDTPDTPDTTDTTDTNTSYEQVLAQLGGVGGGGVAVGARSPRCQALES